MLIFPAIDLLNGSCVRLYQGQFSTAKKYSSVPTEIARSFEESGTTWIHIVDLNASRGEKDNNRRVIGKIRKSVSCRLQTGGGVRSEEDIKELLDMGVDKIILGTVLITSRNDCVRWCEKYGTLLAAGIDARNGEVKVEGWEKGTGVRDTDLAGELKSYGLSGMVYTSIARDGLLTGPDINRTNRLAEESDVPVILSGGIGSYSDVENVYRSRHPRVVGIITGKAIYEKKLILTDLINNFEQAEDPIIW